MKTLLRNSILALALICSAFGMAAQVRGGELLMDNAGLLTQSQRITLLDTLRHFAASTSNAIMVVTVTDLNGESAMEAAYAFGEKYGVGTKEHDNGVVVLVKPKTAESRGEMAIAVGYGLEGAIPDATCKMIVMREAIPEFQRGDYYAGIMKSVEVLMPLARGEYSYSDYGKDEDDGAALVGVFAILLAIIFVLLASRGRGDDSNDNNNTRGGGRTFGAPIIFTLGSGGFGGGSGFGGSGGGFGGFGGGSFGGGGASGSW